MRLSPCLTRPGGVA